MGRLEITRKQDSPLVVTVTLSRRNALTLLSKLEMHGSARTIGIGDTYVNGAYESMDCWLRIEDDETHYGSRGFPPGRMHEFSEEWARERGAMPGETFAPLKFRVRLNRDEQN